MGVLGIMNYWGIRDYRGSALLGKGDYRDRRAYRGGWGYSEVGDFRDIRGIGGAREGSIGIEGSIGGRERIRFLEHGVRAYW